MQNSQFISQKLFHIIYGKYCIQLNLVKLKDKTTNQTKLYIGISEKKVKNTHTTVITFNLVLVNTVIRDW